MKLSREYCSCYHKNMADTLVIAVLAGTTRVQRKSVRAAKYVADFGRSLKDVEIIFADPNDFNFAGDGNDPEGKDPKYSELTKRADAFFIEIGRASRRERVCQYV